MGSSARALGILMAVALCGVAATGAGCTESTEPVPSDGGTSTAEPERDGSAATYDCSTTSRCPSDDSAEAECTSALSGICADEYRAYGQCVLDRQSCGADGRTDADALGQACGAQRDAYLACETKDAG